MKEKQLLEERVSELLSAGGKIAQEYPLSPRYMYKNGEVVLRTNL